MAKLREAKRLADLREAGQSTARRDARQSTVRRDAGQPADSQGAKQSTSRRDDKRSSSLKDVQAQWDAGKYAVTNNAGITLPTNPSSETIRESVDESSYLASRPSSIQFQQIPIEAMKKLSNTLELASLCPLLETQPDALHQIIIDASSSMLALKKVISDRETR